MLILFSMLLMHFRDAFNFKVKRGFINDTVQIGLAKSPLYALCVWISCDHKYLALLNNKISQRTFYEIVNVCEAIRILIMMLIICDLVKLLFDIADHTHAVLIDLIQTKKYVIFTYTISGYTITVLYSPRCEKGVLHSRFASLKFFWIPCRLKQKWTNWLVSQIILLRKRSICTLEYSKIYKCEAHQISLSCLPHRYSNP